MRRTFRNVSLLAVSAAVLSLAASAAASTYGVVTIPADTNNIVLVSGVDDGDGSAGAPPAAESVEHTIDGILQKYLNFLDLGSGFAVTPSAGQSVVTGLRLFTANDSEPRDPASYLVEGSTAGTGGPWTIISSNALSLPSGRNGSGATLVDPATQYNQLVTFNNTAIYTSYRVTFPTLKQTDPAAANSLQIAEVQLMGWTGFTAGSVTITSQPQAAEEPARGMATFSVAVDGTPPYSFQWYPTMWSSPVPMTPLIPPPCSTHTTTGMSIP